MTKNSGHSARTKPRSTGRISSSIHIPACNPRPGTRSAPAHGCVAMAIAAPEPCGNHLAPVRVPHGAHAQMTLEDLVPSDMVCHDPSDDVMAAITQR